MIAHHAALAAAYQPAGEFALQALDGHLDRMDNTAMNSGLTLHQLANSNARLAFATTKQYNAIKKLLSEIKHLSFSPGTRDVACNQIAPNQQTCTIKSLQAAIKNSWAVGGFYSTHGWGVGLHHISGSCKSKGPGHVDTATCNKPAGPGATKNKGWEDFA